MQQSELINRISNGDKLSEGRIAQLFRKKQSV
jgi:hypothetical protein